MTSKRIFTSQASKGDAYYKGHSPGFQSRRQDRVVDSPGQSPSLETSADAYDCCQFHTALERFLHKWGRDWKKGYLTIEGCFAGDEET